MDSLLDPSAPLPAPADDEAAGRTAADLAAAGQLSDLLADPRGRALVDAAAGNSPFLAQALLRVPQAVAAALHDGIDRTLATIAAATGQEAQSTPALMQRLREQRLAAATLIGLADIAGWTTQRVVAALSTFADAAIAAAVRFLLQDAVRSGHLAEEPSGYTVLAMGKLGAGELNYSSDIDLIVLWDQDRVRLGRASSASDVFVPLTRKLVQLLAERTHDGYVFRTDLRLRPDPGSTAVAMSMAAAEAYYESVGQNWERAALIKARPVAGDLAAGAAFLKRLTPFLWRKHLDFAAIADIHSIKRQIHEHKGHGEIAVRGHNVKLGAGGIREIEFFAQTVQLIAGGRDPSLRVRPTTQALDALAAARRIDVGAARDLSDSYWFLRRVEHRLQMVGDEQTHTLPKDAAGMRRIALFSGYGEVATFERDVRAHLERVSEHSSHLFQRAPALAAGGSLVFTGVEDEPETLKTLRRLGFKEPAKVAAMVRGWHHGRMPATRAERARELLTELMPDLLRAFGRTPHPDFALLRLDEFLGRLPAGVQVFALLAAHPEMLDLLAEVMGVAPRLAEALSRRPAMLDAVLSPAFFRALPTRDALRAELDTLLGGADSFEDALNRARQFDGERKFQVGVQVMRGRADARRAGWMLADLADAVIAALLVRVEDEFARQHGRVLGGRFAILALGKFGAREMSAASDLDLVFLYDAPAANSDGRTPLAASTYYARLGQRVISALSAPTAYGVLYEVDMRLRPSGSQGAIASSLRGFLDYQHKDAWTFEHMALTKGRFVAGDASLGADLVQGVREVLGKRRDRAKLLADVADLRRRVDGEHGTTDPLRVKYVRGGLLDLEFLAQVLELADAAEHPAVLNPDTAGAYGALGKAGLLPAETAARLGRAVLFQRTVQAWLRACLREEPDSTSVPPALLEAAARVAGTTSTRQLMAELVQTQAWVYQIFKDTIETFSSSQDAEISRKSL